LDLPKYGFLDLEADELYIGNQSGDSITVYTRTADGDTAPLRTLSGPQTLLDLPEGVFVDLVNDELIVNNRNTAEVLVFTRSASNDTAPLRAITVTYPNGLVLTRDDEILVAEQNSGHIAVFNRTDQGSPTPIRDITGVSAHAVTSSRAAFGGGSFAAPQWLFLDGFESGTTDAWSSFVP
jgi:6-phosphogluconolactonase (cycloisomerase 2 family)